VTYFLRFANPIGFGIVLAVLCLGIIVRLWVTKSPLYVYPLAGLLDKQGFSSRHPFRFILMCMRLLMLVLLVFLIGKPQLIDTKSKVTVKGINIMLVLDVSGSMQSHDDENDPRSRFEVAQEEAIRFINARTNDAIGLVLFGRDALSRCPLTADKKVLTSIVHDTSIGIVDPDGTVLSRAIVTAANRLKGSALKSNIMIVLTDGEPSPEDISPDIAMDIAKQLGIKIYTIGVGSDQERIAMHPLYGPVVLPKLNKELLESIAQSTGGKFFLARNAHDMRSVYDTIDRLEKSEYQAPLYNKYYDIFMPFLWCILVLLVSEIVLISTRWFSL
jgi:Ca-activated chloride channel family protein